ncbi:histidine decarboxylase [Vibrio azureus]|uniref:Histidine decarboxylase n=1 Tax=Vibrio azureus NBRC 104587 TaxID=1219077 RepID=U3CCM3_9VIBR|nr:histidine decarboxylase [Vibrio azureus]AUI88002.1 histidine decarboxylase [Vibrio azureus]GAD76103.1 hypothetical protein VAZ01S_036_00470 [Vibrio azureus NBRC 104587]
MNLSDEDRCKLTNFWQHCKDNQYFNFGYPSSEDFDSTLVEQFIRFSLNNCGDWRIDGIYKLNSFDFERDIIEFFSQLFKIPTEDSWGYVTNGGTEGNLFSCYLAREMFPSAYIYYSEDTHYSVEKIIRLLKIPARKISSLPNGEINYLQLIEKIKEDRQKHPIIFANIGTTMLGATDNIKRIQSDIASLGIKREEYYIHADAALSGMIMPFVEEPQPYSFDDGIDSISLSGHKMIGSPLPCGIVLVKRKMVEQISVEVDYIVSRDQTISGSRNGHSTLFLWVAIKSNALPDWKRKVSTCLEMAEYIVQRFQSVNIKAWRNRNSNIVVIPCPSKPIWRKYSLAHAGNIAHIITMPHHDHTDKVDNLIQDIIDDLSPNHAEVQFNPQRCIV